MYIGIGTVRRKRNPKMGGTASSTFIKVSSTHFNLESTYELTTTTASDLILSNL